MKLKINLSESEIVKEKNDEKEFGIILSVLRNLPPSEIKTDKVIPNSFSSFFSFTISDSERFVFNFKNYIKGNDLSTENINFESFNLIDEISFVKDQEKFLILEISNIEQLENYFKLNDIENLKNIKKINLGLDLKTLINTYDEKASFVYAALLDNSLVITQSVSQIKKIINSKAIKDNLSSNSKYLNFKNEKSKKHSFFWVNNNSNNLDSVDYPFIGFSGVINENIALLDFDYSRLNQSKETNDVFTEFFLSFENEIISDPIWLKNHNNNQYDFTFQDSENYLYYYSNKGNQYWKKKIPQKIIGDIKQVDIYKNGRLQIVFRTEDKLYVLDRNGNEVKELSFEIESGQNNIPISIFDYEKNRNYRFLVTNDNIIEMFDSRGKKVSGFKPYVFESNIIKDPVHIRIDGKDFIVVQLENGELKILDRRGRDRINVDQKIQFSENSIYSYMKTFTTTDNQGNLIQIDMDGKLSKKSLNISSNNLIDIKNDNLVYISENILSIKGININLPFGRYSLQLFLSRST